LNYPGEDKQMNDRWRGADDGNVSRPTRLVRHLRQVLDSVDNPREAFHEFTRVLEQGFAVRKGMLALREENQTRFLAIACWGARKGRRNLSLRLPVVSSLFERVAEDGRGYTDSFAELFDGNSIERRLLLDEDTQSFVLRPIKYEGQVVALLGYSSDCADAFAAGNLIGRYRRHLTVPPPTSHSL